MENQSFEKLNRYKICPKCNYFCNILEKDNYCSLCGSKLIENCPECSEVIVNPYAKYCKKCGSSYPGRNKNQIKTF